MERVGAYFDTQNLFYAAFKLGQSKQVSSARVDYAKLLRMVRMEGRREVKVARAYIVRHPGIEIGDFLDVLLRHGIKTKIQTMKTFEERPVRTDWDVGIAVDIVLEQTQWDTLCLFSGDQDLSEAVETVKRARKRVELYGFEGTVSRALRDLVDRFVPLGMEVLYEGRKSRDRHRSR